MIDFIVGGKYISFCESKNYTFEITHKTKNIEGDVQYSYISLFNQKDYYRFFVYNSAKARNAKPLTKNLELLYVP